MRELFDIDPLTGLVEYIEEIDGKIHLTYEQDVAPVVDYAKALANEGITEGNFRGEGWHYAIIPAVVQMQMLKKGINIVDQNHTARVVREINENYPWLKTTHRNHAIK
jgi:hypothetical protein